MGSRETARAGIALIPWDPASDAHAERMVTQRHACGWDAELVPTWRTKVAKGEKLLFWIVLESGADSEALLEKHREACEEEKTTLRDSAAAVGKTERKPAGDEFLPVGHIALEEYPLRNELFGLPASTPWVKSLYISKVIQGGGLGRTAMNAAEAMATKPPFSSAAIALDTTAAPVHRALQSAHLYGTEEPPAGSPPIMTNQEWYERQGYALMALPEGEKAEACAKAENRPSLSYYGWFHPERKVRMDITTVFLSKRIEG